MMCNLESDQYVEVGFLHLSARLFAGGALDKMIAGCENYLKEKARVIALLCCRAALEDLHKSHEAERGELARLVRGELNRWYHSSRYTLLISDMVDTLMRDVVAICVGRGLQPKHISSSHIVCRGDGNTLAALEADIKNKAAEYSLPIASVYVELLVAPGSMTAAIAGPKY